MTPKHMDVLAMLYVCREFRFLVSKQYGAFNGLTSRPLLLRPSVDYINFRNIDHLRELV